MRFAPLLVALPLLAGCAASSAGLGEPGLDLGAYDAMRSGVPAGYGPPRSEPERALFRMFAQALPGAPEPVWFEPRFDRKGFVAWFLTDADTSGFLTSAYRRTLLAVPCGRWTRSISDDPQGGCGFKDIPVFCDDTNRWPFFKTVRFSETAAVIRELAAEYRIVREDGVWKIDGSRCLSGSMRGVDFNFGEVKRRG